MWLPLQTTLTPPPVRLMTQSRDKSRSDAGASPGLLFTKLGFTKGSGAPGDVNERLGRPTAFLLLLPREYAGTHRNTRTDTNTHIRTSVRTRKYTHTQFWYTLSSTVLSNSVRLEQNIDDEVHCFRNWYCHSPGATFSRKEGAWVVVILCQKWHCSQGGNRQSPGKCHQILLFYRDKSFISRWWMYSSKDILFDFLCRKYTIKCTWKETGIGKCHRWSG